MAINASSPWNKTYVRLEGTFSGTSETHFQIYITTQSGNVFKHRKKVGLGDWGSWTENVSIPSAGASVSLSDGMSAKFTRTSLATYTEGDSWKFLVVPDLLLDEYNTTDNAYSNIAVIENKDRNNLIAFSDTTGNVSIVEDFESDNPTITSNVTANVTPNPEGYSLVQKNKELYVATGKNNNPMWVGYNKTDGFEGKTVDYNFRSEPAYEQLDSTATIDDVFSDFCVIKAGGSNNITPKIYAGIKDGDNQLYIVNMIDNKTFKFTLTGTARRIRMNPAQMDSNNDCNGVAVLCNATTSGADAALDFWEIPITGSNTIGQSTTLSKTIHLFKPEQNTSSYGIHDFLIVSSKASAHTSGTTFGLFISIPGEEESECSYPVFKSEDINSQTADIAADAWINIRPLTSDGGSYSATATGLSNAENKWVSYEAERQSGDNYDYSIEGESAKFKSVQKISLGLMGYDDTGQNPIIGFTAQMAPTRRDTYGNDGFKVMIGSYCDGERLWILRWVTFLIGYGTSGSVKCNMLAHMRDYESNYETAWESHYGSADNQNFTDLVLYCPSFIDGNGFPTHRFLAGSTTSDETAWLHSQAPHTTPMYARGGGIDDGNKFGTIGWGSYGNRHGVYYIRVSATTPRIYMFQSANQASLHPWDKDLQMFPNTNSNKYTLFAGSSTKVNQESRPDFTFYNLPHDDPGSDSSRYRLGDRPYLAGTDSSKIVVATEGFYLSQPMEERTNVGSTERLINVPLNVSVSNDATNLLGSSAQWLQLTNAGEASSKDWIGPTSKKNFYKVSLLYDGFQESTLLEAMLPKDDSNGIDKAITGDIIIKEEKATELSRRISAIILYRAIDTVATATTPGALYRFVEEIPLYKFSIDSNGDYKYTFTDDGNQDASYEAINGISEELTNLNIKYGVNTECNGFHFVGDCSHSQFDDAENVVFRSQPGKYSIFDWSKDFIQLNFKPKVMKGFLGKLYIFGRDRMVIANPQTLVIEDEITGIGCSNKKAIKVTPTGMYWCDNSNIYNSTPQITKIGTKIQKQADFGWSSLSESVKDSAVLGYDTIRQAVLIFFTTDTGTVRHRCWAYSASTRRWDLWDTSHKVYDTVESKTGHAILLLSNGRICKYSSGSNNKNWEWESKKIGFGEDTIVKKLRLAKLDGTARNHTTLQYKSDLEDDEWHSGTDISNNYGTGWQGRAIKVTSAYSKVKWFKIRATATNNITGSNYKGNAVGVIYKRKKPK